jgi:hypothetical protein
VSSPPPGSIPTNCPPPWPAPERGGVAADSETRVRVRIEPGVQRNTSEVYVVSAERPAGSTADVDFTNRSVNTGLDARWSTTCWRA